MTRAPADLEFRGCDAMLLYLVEFVCFLSPVSYVAVEFLLFRALVFCIYVRPRFSVCVLEFEQLLSFTPL